MSSLSSPDCLQRLQSQKTSGQKHSGDGGHCMLGGLKRILNAYWGINESGFIYIPVTSTRSWDELLGLSCDSAIRKLAKDLDLVLVPNKGDQRTLFLQFATLGDSGWSNGSLSPKVTGQWAIYARIRDFLVLHILCSGHTG